MLIEEPKRRPARREPLPNHPIGERARGAPVPLGQLAREAELEGERRAGLYFPWASVSSFLSTSGETVSGNSASTQVL